MIMLIKEFIEKIKKEGNGGFLKLTQKYKDVKNLSFILENLGYLPKKFDGSFLFDLLEHDNPKVRLLSAKNIAKLDKIENLEKLWDAFKSETDTSTRREIVSAIGRLRKEQNKPYLFEILNDEDPKIVCQAIRGLLNYPNDILVERKLKPLFKTRKGKFVSSKMTNNIAQRESLGKIKREFDLRNADLVGETDVIFAARIARCGKDV